MDTTFSSNPSTTWQALVHGLELLKQGIIWRIGCGTQVRIWRDPWIPRPLSLRVTSNRGCCTLRWVSELLDITGRDRDFDKIVRYFNPVDVDAITKIKLPRRLAEDFIAWHPEKSGMFTVPIILPLTCRVMKIEVLPAWRLMGKGNYGHTCGVEGFPPK